MKRFCVTAKLLGMESLTLNDINNRSIDERVQLAQALWDSIPEDKEGISLNINQRQELGRRLVDYKNNPDIGDTWENVKKGILS